MAMFALLMSTPALAEKKSAAPAPKKAATESDRKIEDNMNQEMAACIKSGKSSEDCHTQMVNSGKPMGKMGGTGHGKMKTGMKNRGMKGNMPSDMKGMEQNTPGE